MYLIDTNIFLEILLSQEKSNVCKKFLSDNSDKIFISDFTLHSIGVLLFRRKDQKAYKKFISDVLGDIPLLSLDLNKYDDLADNSVSTSLDFDDSYQYSVALSNNLTIITMDKDFNKVKKKVSVKFL